jgi:hypothetical protein
MKPTVLDSPQVEIVQNFWRTYRDVQIWEGLTLSQTVSEWAHREIQKLPHPGARSDFDELCGRGCRPEILAAILALLRGGPYIQHVLRLVYGGRVKRENSRRNLEKAAKTLEQIFQIEPNPQEDHSSIVINKFGHISPGNLVWELRFYSSFLSATDWLAEEIETRSLEEFGRFVLTAYVQQATGKFNDRQTSGLLGASLADPDANDVAQRMWRHRNYSRLQKHLTKVVELLFVLGSAMSSSK